MDEKLDPKRAWNNYQKFKHRQLKMAGVQFDCIERDVNGRILGIKGTNPSTVISQAWKLMSRDEQNMWCDSKFA